MFINNRQLKFTLCFQFLKIMTLRRAMGIVLALICFAVGTFVLISNSDVQTVFMAYGVTIVIVALVFLIIGNVAAKFSAIIKLIILID